MKDEFKEIQRLLKESKTTDSSKFKVDKIFKELLREDLYRYYLEKASKKLSIFTRLSILNISINKRVALFTFSTILVFVLFISYFIGFVISGEVSKDSDLSIACANISLSEGNVEMKRSDQDEWTSITEGTELKEGSTVRTLKNSRVIVEFDSFDNIRLDANSSIKIGSLDKKNISIEQLSGKSYNRVHKKEDGSYTVISQGISAKALGTAYIVTTSKDKKNVSVYVFESKVEVEADNEKREVNELKKAQINTEKKSIKVNDLKADEYKNDFTLWNRQKDKELGISCCEAQGPSIEVSAPNEGFVTEDESIEVIGTVSKNMEGYSLREIMVNDEVYTEMAEGKGFNAETGEFKIDLPLVEGENVITIEAHDIYWNESEPVEVKITRNVPVSIKRYFYISDISSSEGNIDVNWVMTGFSAPSGFKIVKSTHENPVYPGDDFKYISDGNAREYNWTEVEPGTYYLRVCILNSSRSCIRYTNNKTVVVKGTGSASTTPTVSIKVENVQTKRALVTITLNGVTATNGFKVAWSKTVENPLYPCSVYPKCDNSIYIGGSYSEGTHSFYIDLEDTGNYYFGVSVWNGDVSKSGDPVGFFGPVVID